MTLRGMDEGENTREHAVLRVVHCPGVGLSETPSVSKPTRASVSRYRKQKELSAAARFLFLFLKHFKPFKKHFKYIQKKLETVVQ